MCLTYLPLRIYAIGLEIWEWRVTTVLHSAPQTNVLSHTIRVCIPVLLLIRYELNHTTTSLKKVLSPTFCAADMEFHVSAEIQSQRTHAYKRIGTRDYVCTEDNVDLMHRSERRLWNSEYMRSESNHKLIWSYTSSDPEMSSRRYGIIIKNHVPSHIE